MNNEEIAEKLTLLGKLMELHEQNPFKIKSIQAAAFRIDKMHESLEALSIEALEKHEGIGKSIAGKINELNQTGKLAELEKLLAHTPTGILEILNIKGLGPKKVALLWKELQIEDTGELYYACLENRLITIKGFGEKTQTAVKQQIEFMQAARGLYLYPEAEKEAESLQQYLEKHYPGVAFAFTGEYARKCEITGKIEVLMAMEQPDNGLMYAQETSIPVVFSFCTSADFNRERFLKTAHPGHLESLKNSGSTFESNNYDIRLIYDNCGLPTLPPELMEGHTDLSKLRSVNLDQLLKEQDIRGIIHTHTRYSDGSNTIEEMAQYGIQRGYTYLVVSDHSQSAFYANGLKEDRLQEQWAEIDRLNQKLAPFRIFKSIESDILNDGSLDYPDDLLKQFDMVIASVHSVLKMDEARATERLIRAIENPYTTILGHMTGRLLLSRPGYPLNMNRILDACAANGVVIELNANPHRLDIDWRFIPAATERGIMISVNPDAHHQEGINDIRYGVYMARKGGLLSGQCFNAMSAEEVSRYIAKRKTLRA